RVLPNMETSPEFGKALEEAEKAGVKILYLPCTVKEDEIKIDAEKALEINGRIW
ncbi:MAG TPA: DNA/RNA nuclease SfsA, partial [Candidatus Avilachnospira avistercoris]|nr:DNA/RNA nuclease SfsA [Candidatus Avilachnospira avistercoris]